MRSLVSCIFLIILFTFNSYSQINYEDYFTNSSLRFDYIHSGNNYSESIIPVRLKKQKFYGGPLKNLIEKTSYGEYRINIYDSLNNNLIYSKTFSSLFREWQTSEEAKKTSKAFEESFSFPFPKKTVSLEFLSRNNQNKYDTIYSKFINPKDRFIVSENIYPNNKVNQLVYNGNSNEKVDIVILPDGYSKKDKKKMKSDMKKFSNFLFNSSPFKENKENFNIWSVDIFSEESGTDLPGKNIWKNSALNTSFYTFDSERYLMTEDLFDINDYASLTPYDQIYIIVNSDKYGGGGIYNFYSVCSSSNLLSEFVFIHEFGHAFAGLGDEYYDSETPYSDFIDLKYEPHQPNLTTLVDFESKWKNMIDKDTPIPTPAENKYFKTVGVYEGGGYVSKGVYRPYINCTMHTAIIDGFCPVCKNAIQKMIDYYTDK